MKILQTFHKYDIAEIRYETLNLKIWVLVRTLSLTSLVMLGKALPLFGAISPYEKKNFTAEFFQETKGRGCGVMTRRKIMSMKGYEDSNPLL